MPYVPVRIKETNKKKTRHLLDSKVEFVRCCPFFELEAPQFLHKTLRVPNESTLELEFYEFHLPPKSLRKFGF